MSSALSQSLLLRNIMGNSASCTSMTSFQRTSIGAIRSLTQMNAKIAKITVWCCAVKYSLQQYCICIMTQVGIYGEI